MDYSRFDTFSKRAERLQGAVVLALPLSWHLIGGALAAPLIAGALFVATAKFPDTVEANGSIVPRQGIIEIRPMRAGQVESLAVSEGQFVRAGSILFKVRSEEFNRAGLGASAELYSAIQKEDRDLAQQQALIKTASRLQKTSYRAQIRSARLEVAQIERQITAQRELLQMAQTDLDQAQLVATRGFISKRDMSLRLETILTRKQQFAALEQQRQSAAAKIAELTEQQQAEIVRTATEITQISSNRSQLTKEVATMDSGAGFSMRAPFDGRVAALAAHVGEQVNAQQVVMIIVPRHSRLLCRAYLPAAAIAFVKSGQSSTIEVDALSRDRFGTIAGIIKTVSAAPIYRPEGSNSAPFYPIEIELNTSALNPTSPIGKNLSPGMTVKAHIILKKRTLFEQIIHPFHVG